MGGWGACHAGELDGQSQGAAVVCREAKKLIVRPLCAQAAHVPSREKRTRTGRRKGKKELQVCSSWSDKAETPCMMGGPCSAGFRRLRRFHWWAARYFGGFPCQSRMDGTGERQREQSVCDGGISSRERKTCESVPVRCLCGRWHCSLPYPGPGLGRSECDRFATGSLVVVVVFLRLLR